MIMKQLYNFQKKALEKAMKYNKFLLALDMGLVKRSLLLK